MKMKIPAILTVLVLAIIVTAVLFFKNEGPVDSGHEGHDHGPGEHGQAAQTAAVDMSDWCAEHRVPESECTTCNPALIESFKAKTYMGKSDWCEGHNLPESHCRLCNPGIKFPQEMAPAESEETFDISSDEIEVELFFRKNSPVCATNGALIQFASSETVNRAGLSIQKTFSSHLEHGIEAPAETKFDETHFTVVTISVHALVTKWLVSPGDAVEKDDVLAILNSPEITELQASLLSAHADYEIHQKELKRFQELKSKNLISESEYDRQLADSKNSQANLTSARGLLLAAGMNEKDIDQIIETSQVGNELFLRAPEKGIVVERKAQLGELLAEGSAYAMLADPSSMWIEARLSEEQIRNVSEGQKLTFTSDGRGLNRIGGKIIWVSRSLDPHTRTGIVRAAVVGQSQSFQAGEFGHVTISSNENTAVTLVPKDAVQWEGCCNVVFVKETEQRYRPRKVQLAEGSGPYYQITGGLKPGEEVVVNGAFLLKTELKKSSIGAGCCGLEPAG